MRRPSHATPLHQAQPVPTCAMRCGRRRNSRRASGRRRGSARQSGTGSVSRGVHRRPWLPSASWSRQTRVCDRATVTRGGPNSPNTPTTGLRERGNDTSKSTGRSGRQKAATRRNMRREERVTVQGPVKEQQPDGMSHRGGWLRAIPPPPISRILTRSDSGGSTPDQLQPPFPGSPTAGMGVSAWTHLANGEGSCPPPCGPDTGQWHRDSPGAALAAPPERKEGCAGR